MVQTEEVGLGLTGATGLVEVVQTDEVELDLTGATGLDEVLARLV